MVLKRVLLAYARWNKTVGYCQGFNILAALILEVTEGNEGDALKVCLDTYELCEFFLNIYFWLLFTYFLFIFEEAPKAILA